ncbi:uroporphyrinogen-III synthase [Siccibacter turicensis]|uniref:uroporphyrinogen-III synthase n=1 Tax=Siccibacter turicensis TaxID=357233 RepID=UPI003F5751BD
MSILVTRPSPDGEALVSRLRTQGKVAWSFPLIEFAPGNDLPQLPALFDTLQPDDMVFMVSRHAVQYAHAALQRAGRDWPASLRYFAIGRSTALALHQTSGRQVSYPHGREISEVLLQLPELQNIIGTTALILRGNGGRELIGETLTARGASVTFCECYQRCEKVYDGAQEAHRWQARGVDTLVMTSGEMLHQLFILVPEWYRTRWLLHCKVIVVSERLADLARELGWQDIQVADNADNDALLRALL